MMQLINVVFLAVLFLSGLGLAMAVWTLVLLLVGFFVRRKWIIALWPVGAVLFIAIVAMWLAHQWSPATAFRDEFGFAPAADVRNLRSQTWVLGDSGSLYLTFDASPATVSKIVQTQGLTPGPVNFGSNARPDWWKPSLSANQFTSSASRGGFASEHRALHYDPLTSRAWYEFVGVD